MARIEELKADNIQRIRACLYGTRRSWTRPELARETGLSMAGCENILRFLLERGEIICTGETPSRRGRHSRLYQLHPDYAHVSMLLFSHLHDVFTVHAVCVNLNGEEIRRSDLAVDSCPDLEEVLEWSGEFVLQDTACRALVISFPGIVTQEGRVLHGDFPQLNDCPLREALESRLQIHVRVENDVNLAAEGYRHFHPEADYLAVLYQPELDHAGAGVIANGTLLRGHGGFAGEIGRPLMQEQMRLLHSDPEALLRIQLEYLTAIAAPEAVAWYCPLVDRDLSLPLDIPAECQPRLERLPAFEDLEALIRAGAEMAGRGNIRDMGREQAQTGAH